MKSFPRIYTISTVGLIFHYNSDYLLHPIRTDFNGESGIGKSLIADFLQLIFVGKRGHKYYKPGTESSAAGRGIETLPLDSIGYAFINIQKSENKFITIGIYIQRNTGSITPFIIQKGILWEKNSTFDYHDKILLHDDFLTKDKTISEIEHLRRNILKPKGFILETFQPGDISRYHNLLYYNELLPIDLSQDDDKLITYAQIIQSFARAKTLKLDTKEFKNFLFADDEEIYEEYKNQIKTLEDYQRQYLDQRKTISKVSTRFEVLKTFKVARSVKEKAFVAHLIAKTAYDFQASYSAKQDYVQSKKTCAFNLLTVQYYYLFIAQFEANQLSKQIEQLTDSGKSFKDGLDGINQDLDRANENLKDTVSNIDKLQDRRFELTTINESIDELDRLKEKYGSLKKIQSHISTQPISKLNKQKLEIFIDSLNKLNLYDKFIESYFHHLSFESSFEKTVNDVQILSQKIDEYKALIDAYSTNNTDSIMNWVLNHPDKVFTHAEESVLRHFIKLSTKKPTPESEDRRYIPSPDKLLANLKVTTDGDKTFWINLDGVMEEISLVLDPSFSGPKGLNIATIIERLTEEVSSLANVRNEIILLKEGLQKANFSAELLQLFKQKDSILTFIEDESLPTLAQFQKMTEWNEKRTLYKEGLTEIDASWSLLRAKESELRTETARLSAKKIELDRNYQDNADKLANVEQKAATNDLDVKLPMEKIEAVKNDYFNFIDATITEQASLTAAQGIRKYIKGNSIDTNKLFREEIVPIETGNGIIKEKIKNYEDPNYVLSLEKLFDRYVSSKNNYYQQRGVEFNPEDHSEKYTEESVVLAENTLNEADRKLREIHESQIQPLLPENETIKISRDIETIARELLPKVFEGKQVVSFEDELESKVTGYLTSINESMRQIDDHKLKLIQGIFNKVSNVYDEYDDKIKDIRNFFEEKEITGGMKVKIDFFPSKHYPIEWITALKKQIASQAIKFAPLFGGSDEEELSAEEIIVRTFKQHSDSKVEDPDIRKLTNPKSYFDVEVNLVRPSGEKSEGSSGQQYAKIALLCIARLSRIERNKKLRKVKNITGIRFMPIDEVAGLGGNFELLYQIAQEYDYQILTMTISPDLVFEEGKQFVYILNGDKETNDKKINMPAFGLFSQDDLQENIGAFIKAKTNEKRINVADNH